MIVSCDFRVLPRKVQGEREHHHRLHAFLFSCSHVPSRNPFFHIRRDRFKWNAARTLDTERAGHMKKLTSLSSARRWSVAARTKRTKRSFAHAGWCRMGRDKDFYNVSHCSSRSWTDFIILIICIPFFGHKQANAVITDCSGSQLIVTLLLLLPRTLLIERLRDNDT